MRKDLISVSYFLAFGGLGLVIASLGPIMLALSEQVEAELKELAFIFSSRATGYLAGSILGGLLVDRVPGHRLLFASLCVTAVATALIPLATSVGVLAVLTSMQGLAMGFLDTAGNVLFLWLHGNQNGPWLQAMHCCFAVGAVLSPLFARAAEDVTGSFHLAFWAFSAILLATGICFLFLPSPKPPQEPGPAGAAGFLSALRRLSSSNVSLLLVVASMLGVYVGSEVAFGGYVLTYSHLRLEFDEAQGQFLTAVYWGALAAGRFFAIFLSMRMTPKTVLWLDLIGCVLSSALILVWNASPVALWLGSAIFGFSMASIFPTVLSLAESFMPISGKVASVFIIGASMGELSLPALVGNVIESHGPQSFPWAIVVFSVISLGMLQAVLVAGQRVQRHKLHTAAAADPAPRFTTEEESDMSGMLVPAEGSDPA